MTHTFFLVIETSRVSYIYITLALGPSEDTNIPVHVESNHVKTLATFDHCFVMFNSFVHLIFSLKRRLKNNIKEDNKNDY